LPYTTLKRFSAPSAPNVFPKSLCPSALVRHLHLTWKSNPKEGKSIVVNPPRNQANVNAILNVQKASASASIYRCTDQTTRPSLPHTHTHTYTHTFDSDTQTEGTAQITRVSAGQHIIHMPWYAKTHSILYQLHTCHHIWYLPLLS
jgi:hypothetical protein